MTSTVTPTAILGPSTEPKRVTLQLEPHIIQDKPAKPATQVAAEPASDDGKEGFMAKMARAFSWGRSKRVDMHARAPI